MASCLVGEDAQGIDLPGCADQAAEIFIVDIQQRRTDIACDAVNANDMPLRLFAIDFDGQPVADL